MWKCATNRIACRLQKFYPKFHGSETRFFLYTSSFIGNILIQSYTDPILRRMLISQTSRWIRANTKMGRLEMGRMMCNQNKREQKFLRLDGYSLIERQHRLVYQLLGQRKSDHAKCLLPLYGCSMRWAIRGKFWCWRLRLNMEQADI